MIDQSGFRPADGQNGTGVRIGFGPALYFFRHYIKYGAGSPVKVTGIRPMAPVLNRGPLEGI